MSPHLRMRPISDTSQPNKPLQPTRAAQPNEQREPAGAARAAERRRYPYTARRGMSRPGIE